MNSNKEKLIAISSTNSQVRKNSGSASAAMRKYQQLALAIISIISLMAFLFYKHEYDRLRYTLEYLEMFGSPPAEIGSNDFCIGRNVHRKVNTAPHTWMNLSDDILIYSSFWEDGNRLTNPLVRTVALVKRSEKPNSELQSRFYFQSDESKTNAVCSIEEVKSRTINKERKNKALTIANTICKAETGTHNGKVPYLAQFQIGIDDWSQPILVQENEILKSITNITCMCIFAEYPVSTLKLIEFIAYHNILGIEKFVFFGPILTPLMRTLLDKYGDEANIFYEEKSFTIPVNFALTDGEIKTVLENDCIYRHRDNYENIIVVKLNEFIVPRTLNSLHDVISSVGAHKPSAVSEYHFVSQKVCLDETHSGKHNLLLGSQTLSLSQSAEEGIALIRPHLSENAFSSRVEGVPFVQHIPSAVASIYSFQKCSNNDHIETDHLPVLNRFVELVKKSLLYRKWKISS